MTTIYNTYTGELYELKEEELKNIQEGEIPLTKKPSTSCKKCYGRGHIGYVGSRHMYSPCLQCIEKRILPNYEKQIMFNCLSYKK